MNTILFDLDGTLLPMDTEAFTHEYFKMLAKKLAAHINPSELPGMIWASTKYMISNQEEDKLNMDSFFEDFRTRVDNDLEELHPIFEDFYKNDFGGLVEVVKPDSRIPQMIENLKNKGYTIVVATNPLFPMEAILHRIKWAGLNPEDFKLITSYENMHFCKPQLKYYKEILNMIGKSPEEAMMVGNDLEEDMVSGQLGMKTYLIEDCIIARGTENIIPDYKGNLESFIKFVEDLKPVNS